MAWTRIPTDSAGSGRVFVCGEVCGLRAYQTLHAARTWYGRRVESFGQCPRDREGEATGLGETVSFDESEQELGLAICFSVRFVLEREEDAWTGKKPGESVVVFRRLEWNRNGGNIETELKSFGRSRKNKGVAGDVITYCARKN